MSELKKCPFCGGEAFYIKIMGNYEKPHEIYCSKCNGAITEGSSEKQVVTNWNARPIEDALNARIAELEEERKWIPVSERLPKESGWYYAGVLGRFGDRYTHDVYFYAEDSAFRWKDCDGDKVYCWLDGVPQLPEPTEVQE